MARRDLRIYVSADTRGTVRATTQATKGFSALRGAAIAASGALAGGLVIGAKKSIEAASDLSEQINKARVVFRGSEKDILRWSKTTARSLGISRREALEAAGVFGNMLVPMGFARDRAEDMSKRMVKLAADMASFNNASPAETLDSLRAGLAGESEPLRRFGVFLNDARLKQEALNLHLKNSVGPNGALTANAKAQATYSLILKDTKDAQGDFARTSGSLANQQRILKAEVEDLAAKLGTALLPIVAKVLQKVTKFVNQMQTGKGAGGDFADAVGNLAEKAKDVGKFIGPPLKSIGEFALKHPTVTAMAVALGAFAKNMGALRGTGGGLKRVGGIGGVIGGMKPIPVFVTNPGGIGGGGKGPGGGVPTPVGGLPGSKGGRILGKLFRGVPVVGSVIIGVEIARELGIGPPSRNRPTSSAEARARGGEGAVREFNRRTSQGSPSALPPAIPGSEGADARQKTRLESSKKQHQLWAQVVKRQTDRVSEAYQRTGSIQTQVMSKSARKLSDLRQHTARETARIRDRFKDDSEAGRAALARNFERAGLSAKRTMDRMGKVTRSGLSFVKDMFVQELRLYGLNPRQALAGANVRTGEVPGGRRRQDFQMGGTVVPGFGSGDRIHMQAMVEPGEQVFVLNRTASAALNQLQALNSAVPRFQGGGGLKPGIANLVGRVRKAFPGLSVTSTTGGTHAPGSLHYSGLAADLASGNYQYMDQAAAWIRRRFGPSLTEGIHNPNLSIKGGQPVPASFWGGATWANHRNHIHLAVAGLVRAMRAIRSPRIAGRGPLRDMLQAGMNRTTRAANRRLSSLSGGVGDVGFAGSTSGFSKGRLQNLWTTAGGDPGISNLMAAIALAESGGNPRAHNPSGASGLWQILGQIVPGNIFNPLVNARNAVAKYRLQGLGAWVAYTNGNYRQYLRRGGLVRARRGRRLHGDPMSYLPGTIQAGRGRRQQRMFERNRRRFRREARRQRRGPVFSPGVQASALSEIFGWRANQFAADQALAALTETTADDIAAAEQEAAFWESWLPVAQASGDAAAVTTAAGGLKAARDTLADLRGASQSQADLAEEIKALRESIEAQTKFAMSVAGIGQATALKAFADVISGQIGGYAGQRGRSAGDGVTGARY